MEARIMISNRRKKLQYLQNNTFIILILIVLLTLVLGYISYQELQRERNYLLELARSEGLNIAFAIQTLGSEFIISRNVLTEVLNLFQKEGITYIDILDNNGSIRMSTDRLRIDGRIPIKSPGRVNYIQEYDRGNRRILQIIKPFDFGDSFTSDLFGFIFLRDKYLSIGINLEDYYLRFNQIKQRVIINYLIIFIISLLGVYIVFRFQENVITKNTLRNMKDYTAKLLETMDSGVISVNQHNIVQTLNKKSEEIFQVKRDEVLNRNAEEVLPLMVSGRSVYEQAFQGGEKIEEEIQIKTKDQLQKNLLINTSFLEGEHGEVGGLVILIRDITRLKILSEEMNQNKRLASLGQIASAIAHEIRNPLSSIRGLAQYLFQSSYEKDEQKDDLKIIIKEVDRLNQLINQLLDFSRPKQLNLTSFILENLIKDLINLLKLESREKEVEFQLLSDFSPQYIVADKDQIRQALMNIILNSIQAVSEKGKITISLNSAEYKDSRALLVSIKDDGTGIDREKLPHIFDPFYTTRSKGTGLGLSIAYNIIEMHQGTITVDSDKGKGTEVKVFIPIRRERDIEQNPCCR